MEGLSGNAGFEPESRERRSLPYLYNSRAFDIPELPRFHKITLHERYEDLYARVDHAFIDALRMFTWSLHRCGKGRIYARAQRCPVSGKPIRLYMHHLIADLAGIKRPSERHTHLDHENTNGLDNFVRNLSWKTPIHNRFGSTSRWGQL